MTGGYMSSPSEGKGHRPSLTWGKLVAFLVRRPHRLVDFCAPGSSGRVLGHSLTLVLDLRLFLLRLGWHWSIFVDGPGDSASTAPRTVLPTSGSPRSFWFCRPKLAEVISLGRENSELRESRAGGRRFHAIATRRVGYRRPATSHAI